jgi:hypothetical protein
METDDYDAVHRPIVEKWQSKLLVEDAKPHLNGNNPFTGTADAMTDTED